MGGYLILKSSCLTRVRLKTLTCVTVSSCFTVEALSCFVSLRISASFSDRAACSVATLGPPSLPWNRKFMDTEHVFCISPSISCFWETLETCQRWLTIQTFNTYQFIFLCIDTPIRFALTPPGTFLIHQLAADPFTLHQNWFLAWTSSPELPQRYNY